MSSNELLNLLKDIENQLDILDAKVKKLEASQKFIGEEIKQQTMFYDLTLEANTNEI